VAAGGQGVGVVGAESLKEIPVPGLPQREVVCRCWEFRQRRQCRLRLSHGPQVLTEAVPRVRRDRVGRAALLQIGKGACTIAE
jgi:hypothetical protein